MRLQQAAWLAVVLIVGIPHVVVAGGLLSHLLPRPARRLALCPGASLVGVDIVVPVRGVATLPDALIELLQEARQQGARLVILESVDGHQGQPHSWVCTERRWGTHCCGPSPSGFKAGVLNHWLELSTAEIVVILDGDWRVEASAISALVTALRANERAAFAQGGWEFLNEDSSWIARCDAGALRVHHDREQRQRAARGAPFNMNGSMTALRRRAALDGGAFDETQVSEDVDLAFRLAGRGWGGLYLRDICGSGLVVTSLVAYRDQKVRWAAGRLQALWRHGPGFLRALTPGGLLNLQYLLEYATTPGSAALLLISIGSRAGILLRLLAVALVLAPGLARGWLTADVLWANDGDTRSVLPVVVGDWLLRSLLSGTSLFLTIATAFGWRPPWMLRSGRPVLLCLSSAALIGALCLATVVSDPIGVACWIMLVGICGSGLVLWARPSVGAGPMSA